MGDAPVAKRDWPLIGWFRTRLENWAQGRMTLSDLDHMGREEASRTAHDVSLSSSDLVGLAERGPQAADLLPLRLAAQHLDPQQLVRTEAGVLRDMQRLCTMCASKGRCARELAEHPDDPAWRSYCPNVATIDAETRT
jgi:hypothetical protein